MSETCDTVDERYFHCTLPKYHAGPHEAHGPLPADELCATWPNDEAPS